MQHINLSLKNLTKNTVSFRRYQLLVDKEKGYTLPKTWYRALRTTTEERSRRAVSGGKILYHRPREGLHVERRRERLEIEGEKEIRDRRERTDE